MIGEESVDIYPWELAYVPANNLNWRRRPSLHSGQFGAWVDENNAQHFASEDRPQFILWHLETDRYGEQFGGIDNKYSLNDEPRSFITILNHYNLMYKSSKHLLFSKSDKNNLQEPEKVKSEIVTWNHWISVPEFDAGILRVKFNCTGNLLRKLKTKFYKDEAFFIEYKLVGGDTRKYRIIPGTAAEGLWVNPLILKPSDRFIELLVKEVRFSCTNTLVMNDEIELEWMHIGIDSKGKVDVNLPDSASYKYQDAFALFGKSKQKNESIYISSLNDFEEVYEDWTVDTTHSNREEFSSQHTSYTLDGNSFSPYFTFQMSKLDRDSVSNIRVSASVWAKLNNMSEAKLVISIENEDGPLFWQSTKISYFTSNEDSWVQAFIVREIPEKISRNSVLKVYVWNTGKNGLLIDDINVKISKIYN